MKERRKIDRRRFLRELVGMSPFLVFGPSPVFSEPDLGAGLTSSLLPLVDALNHRENAEVVGREYLRSHPDDRLLLALARWTDGVRSIGPSGGYGLSRTRKVEMLRRRIRSDFDLERTVEVGGWILSLTEARLCALVALSHS